MNIYDIFKRESPRSNITWNKLMDIRNRYCPDIPVGLLSEHRKIYHLQNNLKYWQPVNKRAKSSSTGNYINPRGEILNTHTEIYSEAWCNTTVYRDMTQLVTHRRAALDTVDHFYRYLQDRRYNIVIINEHTIPKWDPKTKTLCVDQITDKAKEIERLLKHNFLVLRAKHLEDDQYELWTFSLRSKKLQMRVATITSGSIGFGKTRKGSKKSCDIKLAKRIGEALDG